MAQRSVVGAGCDARKGKGVTRLSAEWDSYLRWNVAIAEVVFSRDNAGQPVYLDLEDDVLAAIRDIAAPDGDNAAAGLVAVVKATLDFSGGPSKVFAAHLYALKLWHRGSMLGPPPTLAVLAILSLAAEVMHEGEGMKPHNFYGRLAELLDLDDAMLTRVQDAYRRPIDGVPFSEWLWDSLNDWLEMLEGNRGLPTAFALGHAHIGMPLSQALVRQTDRERFGGLFALNSLPPRSSLTAFDMEPLIDDWISRTPCPASNALERLWKSGAAARTRITEVAVLTLESWEGTPSAPSALGASAAIDNVRAKAVLRTFPARRLDVGLVVPAHTTEAVEVVEVIDAQGSSLGSLELVPAASNYLGLPNDEVIDSASFLSGEVLLRRPGQSQPLRRRSRRAVPMRRDELLLAWVECERVQLGEESLVLVRSEIAPAAVKLLNDIARPGFEVDERVSGLPSGWTLFSSVQILSSIPFEQRGNILVDLNIFQPLSSSQLMLQGGLRLPGNIAKWSSSLPPELRVSTDSDAGITASITCTRPRGSPRPDDCEIDSSGGVLLWDLTQASLVDGDYRISVNQRGELRSTLTLRLRSADSPALAIDDNQPPIAHDPAAGGFGLLACRTQNTDAIRGAVNVGAELHNRSPPSVPDWHAARKEPGRTTAQTNRLSFPAPYNSSCMVTGGHLMALETARHGVSTVAGVCRHCGLVKRYPAFRGKAKSRRNRSKAAMPPRIEVSELPPVRTADSIDWAAAFDAVCHVGAGPASALARIAAQMEGSSLFSDAFERRLEQLGHIEIERSTESLAATSWEVVEPLLVGLGDGTATVTGFRSVGMILAIEDHVQECEGTLTIEQMNAPPVIRVAGLSEVELEDLAALMGAATDKSACFIPRAAQQMCTILPALSKARQSLPTTTSTGAPSCEKWNPVTARFEPAQHASSSGAFRLSGAIRTYVYRTLEDVGEMRATLGDARIVKYLAAADAGRSLIGYDKAAQVLYVPLGADLPGLYGRAAVLCSGCPPRENLEEGLLEYRGVSPNVAARLAHLLMS